MEKRVTVNFDETNMIVHFLDTNTTVYVPLIKYWRLEKASDSERQNYIIYPDGIHWPDIDEDVSLNVILHGVC